MLRGIHRSRRTRLQERRRHFKEECNAARLHSMNRSDIPDRLITLTKMVWPDGYEIHREIFRLYEDSYVLTMKTGVLHEHLLSDFQNLADHIRSYREQMLQVSMNEVIVSLVCLSVKAETNEIEYQDSDAGELERFIHDELRCTFGFLKSFGDGPVFYLAEIVKSFRENGFPVISDKGGAPEFSGIPDRARISMEKLREWGNHMIINVGTDVSSYQAESVYYGIMPLTFTES